jgi:hypothetical protein
MAKGADGEIAVSEKSNQGRFNDMKKSSSLKGESPSQLIDARIRELDDWRSNFGSFCRVRAYRLLGRENAREYSHSRGR